MGVCGCGWMGVCGFGCGWVWVGLVVNVGVNGYCRCCLALQLVFDYKPGDRYCCVADIGWITGHSYVVYGPLSNAATTVLFESTPEYPDPGKESSLCGACYCVCCMCYMCYMCMLPVLVHTCQ